jgi:sterol O-acyltransferase
MVYMLCCRDVVEGLGKNLTLSNFVMSVLRLMLPSMLFLILGFFGFLHSWLNGWAELTRFPDRIFYLDWWNSTEFGTYYRKWNIVVHDWLYYYVYLDLNRFVFRSSKRARFYSKLSTFLISALIHELILIEASGFFYPVLFLMFTGPGTNLSDIGIILIQNQKRLKIISSNFSFWIEMYLGTSLLFVLYLMEYYARSIVSSDEIKAKWGILGFLVPRTAYLK